MTPDRVWTVRIENLRNRRALRHRGHMPFGVERTKKKASHFTNLPPLKVRKVSDGCKMNANEGAGETETGGTGGSGGRRVKEDASPVLEPTLKCLHCGKITRIGEEGELDSGNHKTGKLSLTITNELFGGPHDMHCVLHTYLSKTKDCSGSTSLSDMQSGMLQAKNIFLTAVPSSLVIADVPALQLYRCKISRMNAMKRKLGFYIRKGEELPSAKRLASIFFNDRENSMVQHGQVIISEAILWSMLRG